MKVGPSHCCRVTQRSVAPEHPGPNRDEMELLRSESSYERKNTGIQTPEGFQLRKVSQ